MGCEAMQETLDDDDKMEHYRDKLNDSLNSTFGEPNDAPDDALDSLLGAAKFKEMSKIEYAHFKTWMDKTHGGWETMCGLVPEVNPETDRAEWVVPGTFGGYAKNYEERV